MSLYDRMTVDYINDFMRVIHLQRSDGEESYTVLLKQMLPLDTTRVGKSTISWPLKSV